MIDPNAPPPPRQLGLQNQFRPQGFYTSFKQWPIYPNSSNQYWVANQVIKFYNTIDTGVMDPYRSTIDFTIQTDPITMPVGGIQIDKLATSMFSSMVVTSRNVQIQRIQQYDTLGAMLNDLGTSQIFTQNRDFQGLGYTNIPTNMQDFTSTSSAGQVLYSWGNNTFQVQQINQSGMTPSRVGSWIGRSNCDLLSSNGDLQTPFQVSGLSPVNASTLNYLWQGTGNIHGSSSTPINDVAKLQGRFLNIRTQYNSMLKNSNFPDTTTSYLQLNPYVQNQTWTPANMQANNQTSGFNPKSPYQIRVPNSTQFMTYINGSYQTITLPTQPNLMGFGKPYCADSCKSANSAVISPTILQNQMVQGLILPNKVPVSQRRFSTPLLSSVVGALIPSDQFLLIQMKALKDLLVQLTISPYGVFTTGYCDVHQFDQYGMSIMQKRAFKLTNTVWNIHLYTFGDSQINRKLNESLTRGIAITSAFYFIGNTFQLPNGQVVRNMWPISCQSESLSQIYCVFLSNQYQKYSFCRKQFRLSNNIQSMQVRLKTDFFPSQPLIGNAGNPYWYQNQPDNSVFLKQLYWSNNYMFNMNIPMPKINKMNFAINARCYNTGNTSTYYDPKMYFNNSYKWTANSVNSDTAMGMSWFHQNRYVGMAIYCWTWDPYGHSSQYMNGINTNGNQNFGVQFTTSAQNWFPMDETLVIFCRSNGIVLYSQQGVKVIGR